VLDAMPKLFAVLACLACSLAFAQSLLPTPADMLGPYYPDVLPADQDSDLVQIRGQTKEAAGRRLRLAGRVLETTGQPVPQARVEIWQTDANGRYIHSQVASGKARDPFFQGFGTAVTGADGGFAFRTVVPVAYGRRPPHVHVRVLAEGRAPFVTQLYLPDRVREPGLSPRGESDRQARQTLRLEAAGEGLKGHIDLVLAPAAGGR
jgi:protocatechuate 3,4-dioxygenase, beta subunit